MIPEEAIEAVAKYLADEAFDWVDLDDHDHTLECTNWEAYTVEARLALEAALPLIRAQIAANIRDEMNRPERIEMADRYEGYFQGQRSGLETAASIAEEGN